MTEGSLLTSVRVLDLSSGHGAAVGRLLADLGAEVLKIEAPTDTAARLATPTVAGASISFLLNNANKRCARLDPARSDDRQLLIELASTADIVIDSGNPGNAKAFGTSLESLAKQFDHLVAVSVSDFGLAGPYSCWRATDAALYAMSSALSRTGPTIRKSVV